MSGLPESGHDWAIYEYTPLEERRAPVGLVRVRPAEEHFLGPQGRGRPGVHRGRAAMSRHRLFYFMELKEPKATHGLFPSLSWCCYRVEWRSGQIRALTSMTA
jgi:hypothetical protein